MGFKLNIQIGGENDLTDDPTTAWSEDKQVITIGHLMISKNRKCVKIHYCLIQPIFLKESECSEDRILHFRHSAYAVSYERRINNQ
ncbi:hypothetical protein KEH51_18240 [[Brevibacterium] frigoritolerans]|uniref:Uncharacterized protein n=1 Tax=Peribacillus frigoritolerans TaxID=450367 RepID=A0A941FSL8_9BACI|nr:hypothetical protein [Peribacillus frigoritolerans]